MRETTVQLLDALQRLERVTSGSRCDREVKMLFLPHPVLLFAANGRDGRHSVKQTTI